MPVDLRVNYQLFTMMNWIYSGQCPTYSADMVRSIDVNTTRSGLRSTDTAHYQQLRCSAWGFSYAGPMHGTLLPQSLYNITDAKQFRMQLKTYYFSRTFLWQCYAIIQWVKHYKSSHYYWITLYIDICKHDIHIMSLNDCPRTTRHVRLNHAVDKQPIIQKIII